MVSKIQTMGKFNDPTTTSFRVFKIAGGGGVGGGGVNSLPPPNQNFYWGDFFIG